jgi:two-component system cell cycle sensor histidine kinase/response regulator CckA
VRAVTRRALQHLGYAVLVAETPEDAIAAAADPSTRIDLLLTDIVMPLVGGVEVAARVRGHRPDIPVLLMSGYWEQSVGDLVGRERGYAFLPKPFTRVELSRRLREALGTAARDVAGVQGGAWPQPGPD